MTDRRCPLTPAEVEALRQAIRQPRPARSYYDRIWGADEHDIERWERLSQGEKLK